MASLAAVSTTDMIATTSHLFATRYAKAYRLIVRETPFPEIRFTSTVIGSATRMNDPVIRWFCDPCDRGLRGRAPQGAPWPGAALKVPRSHGPSGTIRRSASARRFDRADVDLPHLHHRLEGAFALSAAGRKRAGQGAPA